MEEAPSERLRCGNWLLQLEWENKMLLDQAVVARQTLKNHLELIDKLEQTTRPIYELVNDLHPKGEEPCSAAQMPIGRSAQVGPSPPPEVIMRRKPFSMTLAQQPIQPQLAEQKQEYANPPAGLPPPQAALMAGEDFPSRRLSLNFWGSWILAIAMASSSITTNVFSAKSHPLVGTNILDMYLNNGTMGCLITHQRLHESK